MPDPVSDVGVVPATAPIGWFGRVNGEKPPPAAAIDWMLLRPAFCGVK
jgi:hypothetical protein